MEIDMLRDDQAVPLHPEAEEFSSHGLAIKRPMIDLFAGCGGLSLGFEHAGFTPIFVNELNDDARATYLANRRHRVGSKAFNEQPELWSSAKRVEVRFPDQIGRAHV